MAPLIVVNGSIDRVLADLHLDVDHRRLGVDDADPRAHVPLVDRLLSKLAHLRQRHPVVDPEHQVLILDRVGGHRLPVGPENVQHLRQIQLALGVLGSEARQRLRQRARVEGVDTGVHLFDLELLRARIARPASSPRLAPPRRSAPRTTRP